MIVCQQQLIEVMSKSANIVLPALAVISGIDLIFAQNVAGATAASGGDRLSIASSGGIANEPATFIYQKVAS